MNVYEGNKIDGEETAYVREAAALPGYRVLSDKETAVVAEIKAMEQRVGELWASIYIGSASTNGLRYALRAEGQFRDGFMNLVRTVTLPRDPYREAVAEIERENRT